MSDQQQAAKRKGNGLARRALAAATALLLILTALPLPTSANSSATSAIPLCNPKSRVRGSHLFRAVLISELAQLSQTKHQGCVRFAAEVASDPLVYDGDGNRVAKTVAGVTTKFLVDTQSPTGYAQVVEEIVAGNGQRVYVHGHSLISQSQLINNNWTGSFYGYDGHGSVRLLTDAAGAITDTYAFDAFGTLIASSGTTPNNYLYAGEQFDPNLGFYYLRARYLDPSSGRFVSMDWFVANPFDPRSLHRYSYAGNQPVTRLDPSGYSWDLKATLIVVGVVAVLAGLSAVAILGPRLWGKKQSSFHILNFDWRYLLDNNQFIIGGNSVSGFEYATQVEQDELMTMTETLTQTAFSGYPVKVVRGSAVPFRINIDGYSSACGRYDHTGEAWVYFHAIVGAADKYRQGKSRSEFIKMLANGIAATTVHEFGHYLDIESWDLDDPSLYEHHSCNVPQHFDGSKHFSSQTLNEFRRRWGGGN